MQTLGHSLLKSREDGRLIEDVSGEELFLLFRSRFRPGMPPRPTGGRLLRLTSDLSWQLALPRAPRSTSLQALRAGHRTYLRKPDTLPVSVEGDCLVWI
jgi:hypothetical protein